MLLTSYTSVFFFVTNFKPMNITYKFQKPSSQYFCGMQFALPCLKKYISIKALLDSKKNILNNFKKGINIFYRN